MKKYHILIDMFNNQFMNEALRMAKIASTEDEVPVGAIIVDPVRNRIIAEAYNLVEKKKDPTAHAEILAIQTACQVLNSKFLNDLDLYVTLQPCPMCMKAIEYSRIKRVYFGAYDISISLSNHNFEIYGGIEEERCKALLDNFFKSKR